MKLSTSSESFRAPLPPRTRRHRPTHQRAAVAAPTTTVTPPPPPRSSDSHNPMWGNCLFSADARTTWISKFGVLGVFPLCPTATVVFPLFATLGPRFVGSKGVPCPQLTAGRAQRCTNAFRTVRCFRGRRLSVFLVGQILALPVLEPLI